MNRDTLRGILIFIIIMTVPCYLIGFAVWLFEVQDFGSSPTDRPRAVTATFTPIDPDVLLTNIARTTSPTPLPATQQPGLTPLFPTSNIPTVAPATLPPTIAIPTVTVAPPITLTFTPPPTASFTPTQPILLPASDTPNP